MLDPALGLVNGIVAFPIMLILFSIYLFCLVNFIKNLYYSIMFVFMFGCIYGLLSFLLSLVLWFSCNSQHDTLGHDAGFSCAGRHNWPAPVFFGCLSSAAFCLCDQGCLVI